jgi:AhpD family alkylhydroperoxidase
MLVQSIIDRQLDKLERQLGVAGGVDYLRQMSRSSRALFVRFMLAAGLAGYHRALPADAFFTASLSATRREGCGDCLDMGLSAARAAGVDEALLRALAEGRSADLPQALAQVQRFTDTVLDGGDDAVLRAELRVRYGDAGLMELATAIASARLFPVTKRALGFTSACRLPAAERRANAAAGV